MAAKIHVERMMHRNSIAVKGESAASYALLKLIPTGDGPAKPLGLNLALVLDVSGSMFEEDGTGVSRLQRVQEAALRAIGQLRPEDTLAVVGFGYNALVLLPATKLADRAKIESVIRGIDRSDIDQRGTSMDEGMKLALAELSKGAGPGKLSQMLVLTDGETSGEERCKDLARETAQKGMTLTLLGVGTEWNSGLVKHLAQLGNGKWHYVEAEKSHEMERVFVEEFGHLAAATFTNVQVHLRPVKDVKVKRCRQVAPEIRELPPLEAGDRHHVANLGTLEKDQPTRYVVDLSLPPRPDGNYVIAQVEVTYEVGGQKDTTGLVPLQIAYTSAGHGPINAEVAKHIDEVQIYELNSNLQQAIANNNAPEIQRLAATIEKKGEVMGPRGAKKTMLARQALQELNAGGKVTRKTMLALEDSARLAEEMPVG